jgi:hypothetical protein
MPQWIPEKKLEPEAVEGIARTGATADSVVGESVIALSRAISARRSADALEQIALSLGKDSGRGGVIWWLEQIAEAANAR